MHPTPAALRASLDAVAPDTRLPYQTHELYVGGDWVPAMMERCRIGRGGIAAYRWICPALGRVVSEREFNRMEAAGQTRKAYRQN